MSKSSIDGEIIEKIKKLAQILKSELTQDNIIYIEDILGMSYGEALEEKPVELFLLLLESYMEYIYCLLMIYQIDRIFVDLKVEARPAFLIGESIIPVDKILYEFNRKSEYHIESIVELYKNLFIKDEGKIILSRLISMVENEALRYHLAGFFLGDEYERYSD